MRVCLRGCTGTEDSGARAAANARASDAGTPRAQATGKTKLVELVAADILGLPSSFRPRHIHTRNAHTPALSCPHAYSRTDTHARTHARTRQSRRGQGISGTDVPRPTCSLQVARRDSSRPDRSYALCLRPLQRPPLIPSSRSPPRTSPRSPPFIRVLLPALST